MTLREIIRLNAAAAVVFGLALGSFVQPAAYHLPDSWQSFSMLRFAGAALLALGIVLWTAGEGIASVGRRAAHGLLAAHLVAAAMVGMQQVAIWDSAAGWLTTAAFAAFALAYAVAGRREPRQAPVLASAA